MTNSFARIANGPRQGAHAEVYPHGETTPIPLEVPRNKRSSAARARCDTTEQPCDKNFRKVEGFIYARGKGGMLYVHRRIPSALRWAYPPKKSHITRSLNTASLPTARRAVRVKLAQIEAEFEQKKAEIDLSRAVEAPVRVGQLTERQLRGALDHWARDVLIADDVRRAKGISEAEFVELEADLQVRLATYRRALAMGQVLPHLETFTSHLARYGILYSVDGAEAGHVARLFVECLVKIYDHMLARLSGEVRPTDDLLPPVPHPMYLIAPERAPLSSNVATWDSLFTLWRDEVIQRPKPTTVANMTAWRDLRGFAELNGIVSPADVTAELIAEFVKDMKTRLALRTLKGRLRMVRKIYAVAVEKSRVPRNPAVGVQPPEQASAAKRKKKRLPFSHDELLMIFGSQVYRENRRSPGQAGEATYWIPLIMYYTGARPEEVAGLALEDVRHDKKHGWYFNIIDRFDDDDDDEGQFDDEVPRSHRRTLKNSASTRQVPLAKELLNLGLMRYIEHVRASGATVLFPTLRKDSLGKLAGAFIKVFSRIKTRELGITDKRKVLYSLRHTMKNLLEEAEVPSKALKRILGHKMGDGDVTDGYGSDLPFKLVVKYFSRVRFPPIPALPWEPGQGELRFPR